MRCLSCNYDLSHLSSGGEHRCPECGRAFDPSRRATFGPRLRKPLTLWKFCCVSALTCAGIALLFWIAANSYGANDWDGTLPLAVLVAASMIGVTWFFGLFALLVTLLVRILRGEFDE